MKRNLSFYIFTILFVFFSSKAFTNPFNSKLTENEYERLKNGNVVIRNINFYRNICLSQDENQLKNELLKDIKDLNPKYLAEVIQIRPFEGNEDLPERMKELLFNIPDYAGIPYYSERAEEWYNLYDSAVITSKTEENERTILNADLEMKPFGIVKEKFEFAQENDTIIYIGTNQNKLRYYDDFDCVWPKKMKMCILLFRDGDNWVLYGIGGVNAPRIPFFTERIETSFINRIKTFCNFIFTEL